WTASASYRLIIGTYFGVLAQDFVDCREHLPHSGFRDRALDDNHEFRLVRGGANKPPGAVHDGYAHAIDGDEIADFLAYKRFALRLHRLETFGYLIGNAIFFLVVAMRRHGWRAKSLGQVGVELGHRFIGIAV